MPKRIFIDKSWLMYHYCDLGLGSRKIAKILNCSATKVLDAIKEYNLKPHRAGEQNPREDITKEILMSEYITKQKSPKEIAKELNCSEATILNKLRKFNIKTRNIKETNSSPKTIKKRKQTNLKRYGVVNPQQNKQIRQKTKETNLERYGVEYVLQNKEIQEKANKNRMESLSQNEKIKRIEGKRISEIAKELNITDSWVRQLIRVYGDDFVKNYEKKSTSIELRVKKLLTESFLLKEGKDFLYNKGLPERPSVRPDFLLFEKKLIIECDGNYWHGNPKMYCPEDFIVCSKEKRLKVKDKWKIDEARTKLYQFHQYTVLRFWQDDIVNNWDWVKEEISSAIKNHGQMSASCSDNVYIGGYNA